MINMAYVIKDEKGNYISNMPFLLSDCGWLYSSYTGKTTGFTYYTNYKTAEDSLIKSQNLNDKHQFGKKFNLKHIDLKLVKKGKLNVISINNLLKNQINKINTVNC